MSKTRAEQRRAEPEKPKGTWIVIAAAAAMIVVAIGIVIVVTGGDDETVSSNDSLVDQFQPVSAEGELSPLEGTSDDGGQSDAPIVQANNFVGEPVVVPAPGQPTMIAFGAHWCPHCQETFPVIVDWLEDDGAEGVSAVAVATGTKEGADNYPPSEWLTGIGWPGSLVADDESDSFATTYGLTGYPMIVFIDADGVVQARLGGDVSPDQLDAAVASIT
jgi:cytochrome c biogenesis protein CcmG/thiol:disulfide interchange protein DsbE